MCFLHQIARPYHPLSPNSIKAERYAIRSPRIDPFTDCAEILIVTRAFVCVAFEAECLKVS
jgi:hypothetical protein